MAGILVSEVGKPRGDGDLGIVSEEDWCHWLTYKLIEQKCVEQRQVLIFRKDISKYGNEKYRMKHIVELKLSVLFSCR